MQSSHFQDHFFGPRGALAPGVQGMSIGYYSVQEASERSGRSELELKTLVKNGKLSVIEEDGTLWFNSQDIDGLGGPDATPPLTLEEAPDAPLSASPGTATAVAKAPAAAKQQDITEVKIALEPEEEAPPPDGMSKIRAFGQGGIAGAKAAHDTSHLHRGVLESAQVATRCRTFHAKLNDASLSYLDNLINEWVDTNSDIGIKFATSTIGIVEGKHAEPHLIVTLFY
jgi:hypothetical protein